MSLAELEEYTVEYVHLPRVAGILEGKLNEQLNEMAPTTKYYSIFQLANVSRDLKAAPKGARSSLYK